MSVNIILEEIKINTINFIWDTLVQNQSIAPNRFQLLQILLVFTVYTNSIEKARWLSDNFSYEDRKNSLEAILSPWCMNIIHMIGIEVPPTRNKSPDNVMDLNQIKPEIP